VYYSGHGILLGGLQRVCIHDDEEYPLEKQMRDFKNENAENAFVFAVVDTCRSVPGIKKSEEVRGEFDSDKAGIFAFLFSSEPTKATSSAGVTMAAFEYLAKQM